MVFGPFPRYGHATSKYDDETNDLHGAQVVAEDDHSTANLSARENKNVYRHQSPPFFYKGHAMGKKMAGTNEFAFFAVKAYVPGGGPESGRKKFEKCLPAGTGTKIYFSRLHRQP